ncbi:SAM-dependent methyltransferase [Spirillospora sp. CA-255316]
MERRQRDWNAWHGAYDDPASALARRLMIVQQRIREALDVARPGRIRTVSVCAGQGRDLLGALPGHPRGADVLARLVELDAANVRVARATARMSGLGGIEVVEGDASVTDAYTGAVPASLVLVCGVFGNIGFSDVRRTVSLLPQLCGAGAQVIWTRGRGDDDRTDEVRALFGEHGFQERWVSGPEEKDYVVGVHRFAGRPVPLERGTRLFTFVGHDDLREEDASAR